MNKTADWLFYAESDLKTAKAALNEEVTNNACFHAQQTVEKCLKAILSNKGQETPRTHDLLFIFERVKPFNQELSKFNDYLQFLNQFYAPTRYPDALPGSAEEGMPSKEDAEKSIEFAEEIFNFTSDLLKE